MLLLLRFLPPSVPSLLLRPPSFLVSSRFLASPELLLSWFGKGFPPVGDVGRLFVLTEAAKDISFDAMKNLQQQVAQIIERNPHVENVMSFAGAGGPSATLNNGRIFVTLKPREDRPSADEIVPELRPAPRHSPGINPYLHDHPTIRRGGPPPQPHHPSPTRATAHGCSSPPCS